MLDRVMGVFRLNPGTFEEIEHDNSALTQAALVVLIVALLRGLGDGIGATVSDTGVSFLSGFLGALIWTFVGWIIWSIVSWFVGTSFFGGKASIDEMLRVLGFAQAPLVLGIIPCIGWLIGGIWALIAGFIAIRQGLDFDNTKALLTVIVGFIVYVIGMALIGIFTGIGRGILGIFGI